MFSSQRRAFLKRTGFTTAVTILVPSWFWNCGGTAGEIRIPVDGPDGLDWEKRARTLEASGPILTATAPGQWAGKESAHVPQVQFDAARGTVTVLNSHVMTAEHYIVTHYVKDQNQRVIGLHEFQASDPEAKSTFTVPAGTTALSVYSYCNLHDLWFAESSMAATPDVDQAAAQIAAIEARGPALSPSSPGVWAGKEAGHFPQVTVAGNQVTVRVPHEMTAAHYIAAIYLKDDAGGVLGFLALEPGAPAATATFTVAAGSGRVHAFAFCNLHELWRAQPVRLGGDLGHWQNAIVALEAQPALTPASPRTWAGKEAGHVPQLAYSADKRTITVDVRHEMTAAHWITATYLRDQTGAVIGFWEHAPTDTFARAVFVIPERSTRVTAYAHCNQHENWRSEPLLLADAGATFALQAAAIEGGPIYTPAEPGIWAGKELAHTPQLTFNTGKNSVTVFAPHEQGDAHLILALYLKDQAQQVIGFVTLGAADEAARAVFTLPAGATEVTGYALCNLHGVWRSDPLPIVTA